MPDLHIDFDTLLASEHACASGLGPFEPCIHQDSSCLHFTQSQKLQEKLQPPANPAAPFARRQRQTKPGKPRRRKRRTEGSPPNMMQSQDYSWDHIFNDMSVAGCDFHGAGDWSYCKDDDCVSMSCSSACEGGCPSQCGEAGLAVCCDDDACGTPQLCVDEHCQGAAEPCMDENCVMDPSMNLQKRPSASVITDGDKAAAVALASFGDNQPPPPPPHLMPSLYMQQLHPPATNASGDGNLSFMDLPFSMPCGSLSMDSILSTVNGSPSLPNQPFHMAFEFALASHIMQYHDPAHGLANHGSCVANDPSQLIAKCTLPKYDPNDLANTDPFLPQLQASECGFQIQDPSEFAHHIFQQHGPNLTMHAHQAGLQGLLHPPDHSAPHHQHHHVGLGPFHYGSACSAKDFSPAMSPLTNLSVGPSLSATPASLPTPSPPGSEPSLTDHEAFPPIKPVSPTSVAQPQVLGEEDPLLCRWVTGNNNAICGRRFENDEQLQKHCKHDHLKQLKKMGGGFRCGWASCTRDTCFTQRSKVERHMQVHTGYKPVQCNICGAALSAKQALDQHMRIHTGETPWVCKFPGCGCAFKQQSALTMHERTHTGDKPLECEICGKRFSESSNLSKHRRTHNVKGVHECQLCGKDFHRLDQLRRHMGTNHKDRPAEVDALLSEAKSRIKAYKVAKVKRVKLTKARDAKLKQEPLLDLEQDGGVDMIEESIHAVAIGS
ncbi:hypothetical protein UVI_02055380 [Ustilaginoidea virens]|uniref:C2H2 type master regulator of conidiophore development brlA n=1 Tax=Ustilaginoidea virens TaxID=1159556 RepID=A0A1B5KTZ8_USTVR|nr:hypothetical protein UVI_02055380 [Ustilaginoidea virens]